jgi:hypothetical protein
MSRYRTPLDAYGQVLFLEWTVTVLPLLRVLSEEKMGVSLVSCHSQLHCILRSSLSKIYVTNFASVHHLHGIIYNTYKTADYALF